MYKMLATYLYNMLAIIFRLSIERILIYYPTIDYVNGKMCRKKKGKSGSKRAMR